MNYLRFTHTHGSENTEQKFSGFDGHYPVDKVTGKAKYKDNDKAHGKDTVGSLEQGVLPNIFLLICQVFIFCKGYLVVFDEVVKEILVRIIPKSDKDVIRCLAPFALYG